LKRIIKNKSFWAVFITVIFLCSAFSITGSADSTTLEDRVSVEYSIKKPIVKQIEIDGTTYDKIVVDGASSFGNPGEPCLPIKGVYLLLPYNSKVEEITIEHDEIKSLGTGYNVMPVEEPIPISMIKSVKPPTPDLNIYDSDDLFPGDLFDKVGIYSFRGYQILVLSLYPVQYLPSTGEIFYYSDMKVTVETSAETHTNELYHGLPNDKAEVMKKVDNPEVIQTYPQISSSLLDQYDLLILTTSQLKSAFTPLKQAHDARGVSTKIKTLSDITLVPSNVKPENIREFIKTEYEASGIQYVLFSLVVMVMLFPLECSMLRVWMKTDGIMIQ